MKPWSHEVRWAVAKPTLNSDNCQQDGAPAAIVLNKKKTKNIVRLCLKTENKSDIQRERDFAPSFSSASHELFSGKIPLTLVFL